jgi:hypothetical protein
VDVSGWNPLRRIFFIIPLWKKGRKGDFRMNKGISRTNDRVINRLKGARHRTGHMAMPKTGSG